MTTPFFVPGNGTLPAQSGPNAALKPYGILPAVQPESVPLQGVLAELREIGPGGFEPPPPVPKTGVLPLDDGPKMGMSPNNPT